jgi:hypothetical protein
VRGRVRAVGRAGRVRRLGRCAHAAFSCSSFGNRARLYAVAAKAKDQPTRSIPRNFVRRWPAMVFVQPNASSIRLRMRCDCLLARLKDEASARPIQREFAHRLVNEGLDQGLRVGASEAEASS